MKTIFKTWKKATYFKGEFELRDNTSTNWADPIEFPTVFTAYGVGIRSGNWQSCTSINTPDFVIENYFDTIGYNKHDEMNRLWVLCRELSVLSWSDLKENKTYVIKVIKLANIELQKLKTL